MPAPTPYSNSRRVRTRQPNMLASTNYANEMADIINAGLALPRFGQVIDDSSPTQVPCITAKLLAQDDTDKSKFTWQQELRTTSGWESFSGALSDNGKVFAYTLDETSMIDLSGKHVVLVRSAIDEGDEDSPSIKPAWIIVYVVSGVWLKITGNAKDEVNFRFYYAATQVDKTSTGYGGWTTLSGGLSFTTGGKLLLNAFEDGNGASGTFTNGVNSSNLSGTFAIQPIGNGAIVRAWPVIIGSTVEYHFSVPNMVDGACP